MHRKINTHLLNVSLSLFIYVSLLFTNVRQLKKAEAHRQSNETVHAGHANNIVSNIAKQASYTKY
jgi:hypothetical protein